MKELPCLNDDILRFNDLLYTTLICEVEGEPQADGHTGTVRGCRFLTADLQAGTCRCPLLDRRCYPVGKRSPIGLKFRQWREKVGLTRNEAAQIFLSSSAQHLYQIESGRVIPSKRIARAMASAIEDFPNGAIDE